jgi:prevent-host-death family protein
MVVMEVNIHEAKTHLSRLIERALAGEEVIVAKAGKPLVRIIPITAKMPVLGSARGTVTYAEGWDDPMTAVELAEWEDGEVFPK